jgi:ribosomal subunit interface protein
MEWIVTGKNIEITPQLRRLVETKFGKLTRLTDEIITIEVKLISDTHHQRGNEEVHAIISLPKRKITVFEKAEDMRDAINAAADWAEREVKEWLDERRKRKVRTRSRPNEV